MQSQSTLKINKRIVATSRYKAIVADVIRLFHDAQNRLAGAYWKTGQYVVEIEQDGDPRARYGSHTLAHFSAELTENLGSGFSVPSLQRMRRFYQDNPKYSPATKLPWAHHIELMSVADAKVRKALEQKAVREELTRDEVRVLVRHEAVRAQVAENLKNRETEGPEAIDAQVELLKVPKLGVFGACRIKEPVFLNVQPVSMGPELAQKAFEATIAQARETARNF